MSSVVLLIWATVASMWVLARSVWTSIRSWTLRTPARDCTAAVWRSTAALEKATASEPRASAPLVAAVTEAITASMFLREWAVRSFRPDMPFSMASRRASLPALAILSAAVLAAAMRALL